MNELACDHFDLRVRLVGLANELDEDADSLDWVVARYQAAEMPGEALGRWWRARALRDAADRIRLALGEDAS